MRLDKAQVRRYLGIKEPEPQTDALIEDCIRELLQIAVPAHTYALCSLEVAEDAVAIDGRRVESRALAAHIDGCERAVLFAATLGQQADRLLLRESRLHISKAAVLQAACAAAIEAYCDEAVFSLEQSGLFCGLYPRPRFSPGYGDFALSCQSWILERVQAHRRIGLYLTNGDMLCPVKSVTAVIGLTAHRESCHIHNCASCNMSNCAFKRE